MGTGADDAELVRRARLGDRDAFAVLVERHGAAMYRYARRMLHDDGAAEDCVQEALISAWLSADRFRGEAAVRTWLFGILTNTVRRRVRTEARHPASPLPVDTALPEAGDDPISAVQATDLRDALEIALRDLPPVQRACWMLVEVERMSYADVARVQATTVDAVRGAVHRARTTLGRRLAPWR